MPLKSPTNAVVRVWTGACLRAVVALSALTFSADLAAATADPAPSQQASPKTPSWRFRKSDRPVKVVVLAGSIGAWPHQPYAKQLEHMCGNVEVRNLSQVGLGAWALKQRFRQQVLDNRHLARREETHEYWLVYGGGLNSVGTPTLTNKHTRDLFELAHRNRFRVVALTLTPWGASHDRRWQGSAGLERRRATQMVVDFVMGRLTPAQALGGAIRDRRDHHSGWHTDELADIAVDLYDSPLRDRQGTRWDLDKARTMLVRDPTWRRAHAKQSPIEQAAALERDALSLAELPQWFLRPELRSFDHIHPNTEGHRLIVATMCPKLPERWGCTCPDPGSIEQGE